MSTDSREDQSTNSRETESTDPHYGWTTSTGEDQLLVEAPRTALISLQKGVTKAQRNGGAAQSGVNVQAINMEWGSALRVLRPLQRRLAAPRSELAGF